MRYYLIFICMFTETLQKALHGQCYRFKRTGHKAWILKVKYNNDKWLYIKPVIITDGWSFVGKDGIEQYNIDYRNRYGDEAVEFLNDIESSCFVEKITDRKYNELFTMFMSTMKSFLTTCIKGMK